MGKSAEMNVSTRRRVDDLLVLSRRNVPFAVGSLVMWTRGWRGGGLIAACFEVCGTGGFNRSLCGWVIQLAVFRLARRFFIATPVPIQTFTDIVT